MRLTGSFKHEKKKKKKSFLSKALPSNETPEKCYKITSSDINQKKKWKKQVIILTGSKWS